MPKSSPRERKPAPTGTLAGIRASHHLTQEEVCKRVAAYTNKSFTKGALSAIELGIRGPSAETLRALEHALGMPPGSLRCEHELSHVRRPREVEDVPA